MTVEALDAIRVALAYGRAGNDDISSHDLAREVLAGLADASLVIVPAAEVVRLRGLVETATRIVRDVRGRGLATTDGRVAAEILDAFAAAGLLTDPQPEPDRAKKERALWAASAKNTLARAVPQPETETPE